MTGTKGRVVIEFDAGIVPATNREMRGLETVITDYLKKNLGFRSVDVCWEG